MANRKISWDIVASKEFEQGINYIAGNSVQNAEKVRQEIVNRIEQLLAIPNDMRLINIKLIMTVTTVLLNCISIGYLTL